MSIYMYMALEIFYVKVLCYALAVPLSFWRTTIHALLRCNITHSSIGGASHVAQYNIA